jgi:NAD+ dependent glucose-6-phosphate dehydrogenase
MARRVIVTGSTGNLGTKAVTALRKLGGWEIVRVGRNTANEPDVIDADLTRYDVSWAKHFAGAEAVLHLAADPKPVADWSTVVPLNIDLSLNLFRATEEGGARRIIFASSNWVLGGYRFRHDRLSAALPPRPVNPYGASKLFIERYGLSFAERTGVGVLILRVGYCQTGENRPGSHMAFGRWGQEMWLGNRDWEQAVVKAVAVPFQGSAILNIVSSNEGMRWDLGVAETAIGYAPTEGHRPHLSARGRLKDFGARLREWAMPSGASAPRFGVRW